MILSTSLCSGSKGNSLYFEINNKKFLFDAGKSYTYLKNKLLKINVSILDIDYIFITHDHTDHISSLEQLNKKTNAILCLTNEQSSFFEDYSNVLLYCSEIDIEGINIKAIPSSHDTEISYNFVLTYKNKKISFITDTGYIHSKFFKHYKNSDIFYIESNHDEEMLLNGPYPEYLINRVISDKGHLSNNQTGIYLSKLIGDKTKYVILTHLSEKNNTIDLALNTVDKVLKENNVEIKNVSCATQNELSKVITI